MPYNLLADLARRYRKLYPNLKFRIVNARLTGEFATTHFRPSDGTHIITFDREMSPELKAFLLSHEIAHALSFAVDSEEHGPAFWSAYRKSYDDYLKFVESLAK